MSCSPCASALNPSLAINQYAHTAWRVREGFSKGTIHHIAQTPDGYLWLATEFGVLRFDGVRTVPWPPESKQFPSSDIRSLVAARDGSLWLGTAKGLATLKDGTLTVYPELAGHDIISLLEDREGTVWVGSWSVPNARLCAIQHGRVRCYGDDGRFGAGLYSLGEDGGGNVWAGAHTGLWRTKPGPLKHYPVPVTPPEVGALVEGDNGALLLATDDGIKQLVHGKVEAYPIPAVGQQFTPSSLLRDRDGGLWIGTSDRGLLHVYQGRTDQFALSDGLSGDDVQSLFEDREGNIWVATIGGMDRFRDLAVPPISVKQGLSDAGVMSVLAARDGGVWLSTVDGLNRWDDGQITIYRKLGARLSAHAAQRRLPSQDRQEAVREIADSGLPREGSSSLFQDDHGRIWVVTPAGTAYFEHGRFIPVAAMPGGFVNSIVQDRTGDLWISDQTKGLFHLRGQRVVELIPWARLGRNRSPSVLVPDPAQGGLWIGSWQDGVAYFKDGQVRSSYGGADGLGEGRVNGLKLDPDGTLWAATEGGLSRLKNGRIATLTSKNGLPCDTVHEVVEDDDRSFWLYTACGLVRIARPELDSWTGTVDTGSKRTIQVTVFDDSDGVRSHAGTYGFGPRVAKTKDGKLWFLPLDGVSLVDPHHLTFNNLPPPVHIEKVTADRKTYWQNSTGNAASHPRLPPLVRDLSIDYTALSLVAPEKVHFRYKLEGQDPDWKEVVNDREVQYSNLAPRNYRFRVLACNNSGLWNEAGDFLDFSIAPAYYQTTWFRASCVAAFLALLGALYRYRLHQIAQEFNLRLEERVGERTRIARELHDTLLQSFHGLMLRFQGAQNLLPSRPADAHQVLESALDDAGQAITEARDAVQNLRSSTVVTSDLAQAIRALGEELEAHHTSDAASQEPATMSVSVEGTPQDLDPILRDEVYRIAGEALRNAFLHARARRIEVEIQYGERQLQVRVRDDGIGIDPSMVDKGRSGHYGLPGMRERAERIGGQLSVWSGRGAGAEVELRVPGSIAYRALARRSLRLFGRKTRTNS